MKTSLCRRHHGHASSYRDKSEQLSEIEMCLEVVLEELMHGMVTNEVLIPCLMLLLEVKLLG